MSKYSQLGRLERGHLDSVRRPSFGGHVEEDRSSPFRDIARKNKMTYNRAFSGFIEEGLIQEAYDFAQEKGFQEQRTRVLALGALKKRLLKGHVDGLVDALELFNIGTYGDLKPYAIRALRRSIPDTLDAEEIDGQAESRRIDLVRGLFSFKPGDLVVVKDLGRQRSEVIQAMVIRAFTGDEGASAMIGIRFGVSEAATKAIIDASRKYRSRKPKAKVLYATRPEDIRLMEAPPEPSHANGAPSEFGSSPAFNPTWLRG